LIVFERQAKAFKTLMQVHIMFLGAWKLIRRLIRMCDVHVRLPLGLALNMDRI